MDDIINFLIYYSNLFWSLSYLFIYLFLCVLPQSLAPVYSILQSLKWAMEEEASELL